MDSLFREDFTKFREMVIADRIAAQAERVAEALIHNIQLLTQPVLVIGGTTHRVGYSSFALMNAGTVKVLVAGMAPAFATTPTITTTNTGIWTISVTPAGVVARTRGANIATASIADIAPAATPAGNMLLGYVIVSMSGATFTPATTALDAANTTTIYLSALGRVRTVATPGALGALPNMTSY